jgi:polysaccharide export outer membrane protein
MKRILLTILTLGLFCCHIGHSSSSDWSYKIGKRDVLSISVPGNPDFSLEAIAVSEEGSISYPVLGDIEVEGLTVAEVAEKIRAGLIEKKMLLQPTVSVEIKEYRSQSVTILGEVRTTGKHFLKGRERLLDVLAEAGGLSAAAGEININRATPEGSQNIVIKTSELLTDTSNKNPLLISGDVIFIRTRETAQVFVSGEVATEKPLPYVEGMTVYQAVITAGGLTRFGAKNKVKIKRTANGKEEILSLNLSDIEKGKQKDVLLLPNDQIIVGRRVF